MSAEPVPASRVSRVVGKIPLVRRLKRPGRTASPIPLFQARPKVQLAQEDSPVGPVAVKVKVRVAESGAVMQAEVEDYGDPPNWRLAAAALDAARRWTFEPARVEDTAVPSDVILHFRFTP
jgi:TonB family protein